MGQVNHRASRSLRRGWLVACIAPLMLIEVGCATKAPSTAGSQSSVGGVGGTWCEAQTVLQTSCQQCHGAVHQFGAPMSLVTYADLMAPAPTDQTKRVYQLVGARIHDPQRPMPQPPFTLSPQGMTTLDNWIAQGALQGDPSCGSSSGAGTWGGAGTTGTLGTAGTSTGIGSAGAGAGAAGAAGTAVVPTAGTAAMPTAGTTGAADGGSAGSGATTDWPADCDTHYTLLAHDMNNASAKYSVPGGSEQHPSFYFPLPYGTDNVQALAFKPIIDNSQVLHHWILYGGAGLDDAFLSGWAPGMDGAKPLPADVGIYMPTGGAQLRLDVHYNNTGGTTVQTDASGVEFCVTHKLRPNSATVIGLTASSTSYAGQMVTNTQDCKANVTNGPIHLLSTSPHMHKLGTHSSLLLTPVGGATQTLHDGPFSFDEQHVYPLDNVIVNNGDTLTTKCTYDNTTDHTVSFGQNTTDEMCFNFTLYYPKDGFSCAGGLSGG